MRRLRFLSSNRPKIAEVLEIFKPCGLEIVTVFSKIDELQSDNVELIVQDKITKAFEQIGYPVFVEHTVLCIHAMNGFPAGLTQVFWETLEADRVSELFGRGRNTGATARSVIGFCDGRRIYQFSGHIEGKIAPEPRGSGGFQWDRVFIPNGDNRTFAEMGAAKNDISHRRHALDDFVRHLEATNDSK